LAISECSVDTTTAATGLKPFVLAFDRVRKSHASGRERRQVLDDVSFDIAPGEFVGLRGPRRSGKTTLLRIAAGIDLPDAGRVTHLGSPTARSRGERTRLVRSVAFVPKASDWRAAPGVAMLDHLVLPLLIAGVPISAARSKARGLAHELGAEEYVDAQPSAVPAHALMRLTLARALLREPRLLIIDAPEDGMSEVEQQALQGELVRIRRRREVALLVASREASALRGAERVMTLDGSGRLSVPVRHRADVLAFRPGASA
jgi:ABC-type lipoprotein export system ATPase subunit